MNSVFFDDHPQNRFGTNNINGNDQVLDMKHILLFIKNNKKNISSFFYKLISYFYEYLKV
jgi:hypothetical protein